MRIKDLPGQWVWLDAGTPILFHDDPAAPDVVASDLVVRVERISPAAGGRPAMIIGNDDRGEHGIEARRVSNQLMSLPPSGNSPVTKAAEAIGSVINARRR